MLLSFGVFPLAQGLNELRLARLDPDALGRQVPSQRFGAWLRLQPARWSYALAALLAALFLLQLVRGFPESVAIAGLDKTAARSGQWYRLFTGPLLHGGVLHFFCNTVVLLALGHIVEAIAGRAMLLIVFVISALFGSVFSMALLPHGTSVGASGGVLGLAAFLAVLSFPNGAPLPGSFGRSMLLYVAAVALLGVLGREVLDNAAHFGGALGGACLGVSARKALTQAIPMQSGPLLICLGILCAVALVIAAAFTGRLFFR
jgi:membrane associated rhomboid family serine protease